MLAKPDALDPYARGPVRASLDHQVERVVDDVRVDADSTVVEIRGAIAAHAVVVRIPGGSRVLERPANATEIDEQILSLDPVGPLPACPRGLEEELHPGAHDVGEGFVQSA